MCNWEEIKSKYILLADDINKFKDEFKWLDKNYSLTIDDVDENWNNLTNTQKQIKRLYWSKMARKTDSYNKQGFNYEESIIDLYESSISCLNKLNSNKVENIHSVRLKAHLCLLQKNINRYKDSRKIDSFNYEQLKSVIYDCLNSNLEKYFIENINILYLENKLETIHHIISNKKF
ncbi:hypothetical protein [Flavobacterium chilense]|uniref:Uncharacterized protein n=1 Tax=Flavobacterium chilense TaxID=946677 RepID=A0A1M6YIS1_9FLAO|nr:hypothetical protein [Flavobacterium chilense]SHL18191.1 hypothetical protein SAMN05444484_101601 [Flavobacterium chilense]